MDPVTLTKDDLDEALGLYLAATRQIPDGTPYVADLFLTPDGRTLDRIVVRFPETPPAPSRPRHMPPPLPPRRPKS